jgi:hypothetical protein
VVGVHGTTFAIEGLLVIVTGIGVWLWAERKGKRSPLTAVRRRRRLGLRTVGKID